MINFIQFAQKYHIPFIESGNPHCRPGWIQVQCPQCGPDGSHGGWYLGFSQNRGMFNCYRCGVIPFWFAIESLTGIKDKYLLQQVVADHQLGGVQAPPAEVVRKSSLQPPGGTAKLMPQHIRYLESRNFDPKLLVKQWGLLGTGPAAAMWSWRVIIPVHDSLGRIVAYQGRSIGSASPKYRMTSNADILVDPHTLLYGLHRVPSDTVVIVEGVPGVWRLGYGAVATFGIDWKREQANLLREFKNRFIIFDPEPMAQQRAADLAKTLSLFPGNTEILSGFRTDPGDFSQELVTRIWKKVGKDPTDARSMI